MAADGDELTIDELARRVGMTVRNIRAHQSRGLLPPPTVRGRTGFYGAEHAARLELIKDMQADGFNLAAIRHVLAGLPPGADAEVLSFRRALVEPWTEEAPEVVTFEELATVMGSADPALLEEAVKLGMLRPLDESRFEVPAPALLRAGAEVAALGVPADVLVGVLRQLVRHADGVAKTFVTLFLEHVWRPFVEAGQPEEQWPHVRDSLAKMQPLASQALLATFRLSMERHVEQTVATELGRPARPDRKRRRR